MPIVGRGAIACEARAVERVALHERRDGFQAPFADQRLRPARRCARRSRAAGSHPARPPARRPRRARSGRGRPRRRRCARARPRARRSAIASLQQLLDVALALADAAPADRFEVRAVDRAGRRASRRTARSGRRSRACCRSRSRSRGRAATPVDSEAAEAQRRARGRPVQAARRQRRQRRGERIGLLARDAALVGVGQVRLREWHGEPPQQERAHAGDGHRAVALAQRVVIEARAARGAP